jgi:hypothetical protein
MTEPVALKFKIRAAPYLWIFYCLSALLLIQLFYSLEMLSLFQRDYLEETFDTVRTHSIAATM